ncbi:MAG: STAS domain-containing protein [Actinobacteria bacterium]|nr:STAS domain-containing protein [Actinomycetota bacterium]
MLAEAGPLKLDVDVRGDQCVLSMIGELDVDTATLLRDIVVVLTEAPSGAPQVTVDLTELQFMDSTGLGVMVEALALLRTAGGDLRLRSLNGSPRRVVELTGLDKVFDIAS